MSGLDSLHGPVALSPFDPLTALGLGILGDRFYPDLLDAAPDDHSRPLQLLARSLGFTDPLTGQERTFTSRLQLQERPR